MALVFKGLSLDAVDNDTIYDDSALVARVEAIESKLAEIEAAEDGE